MAVGETGLDHYRDYAPRDAQRRLFEEPGARGAGGGRPAGVHTRGAARAAAQETADALAGFTGDVVLHCFSEPVLLDVALERGYYVSFAGNVTYPRAPELREAARAVPDERILTETDSPYLAPQAVRGRRNEPAYLVYTVDEIAAARGTGREELATIVDANADRLFGLR